MSNTNWNERWFQMAHTVALFSKDSSSKCGAVIVDKTNRIISVGYNGFAEGVEETEERWKRPEKYEWVVHAEQNAIINARGRDVSAGILYITHHPCHRCLMHIINAGIKAIHFPEPDEGFSNRWLGTKEKEIFDKAVEESGIKIYIHPKNICETKKTSEEWAKDSGWFILDPDGWDRENFNYSFYIERINLKEFNQRLFRSTIKMA